MRNLFNVNGNVMVLLIGLLVGVLSGLIVGLHIASWNFAGTIAAYYVEIIHTDKSMFVNKKGVLYKLTPFTSDEIDDKVIEEVMKLPKSP